MPKFAQAISKMVLQTGAAGMIYHHTPIANGARDGERSLRGMLDLSVVVQKKPNGHREISYGKAQDGGGAVRDLSDRCGDAGADELRRAVHRAVLG